MKKQMKVLSILALGLGLTATADAQIAYPYVLDFESGTTTPSAKAYNLSDTIVANGVKWTMPGVYLGSMLANDFKNGSNAGRVRSIDNTTPVSNAVMTMHNDLPLGADSLTFYAAKYGTDANAKLIIQYSINQGTSWTSIDTLEVTNGFASPIQYKYDVSVTSPIRFRIIKDVTTNPTARINLDDFKVTAAAQASNIVLMNTNPTGTVHPTNTDKLVLTFNEDVVVGTGNITLFEVGGADQIYDVATSSDVVVTGSQVEVNNITLNPSAAYYVQYDSTAFVGDVSGLKSVGIYDNTTWVFNTSALSLGAFTEDFANCNGNTMLGVFVQQSITGNATWKCDTYNDTLNSFNPPYVNINGGTGSETFDNEDYLITSLPIDFGALPANTVRTSGLKYQEKRRFGGDNVTRGIYYSTDYAGDAATATWVAIDNNLQAIASTGTFFDRTVDITSAADVAQPFYLAFKYESTADTAANAYEWSIDNVEVTVNDQTISINDIFKQEVNLTVLGVATASNINLRVSSLKNMDLDVTLYDLNGRALYKKAASINAGTQVLQLNNTNVAPGMYMIKVATKQGMQAVKVMVH